MRKLKEVLRLESLGLSQHQIARSCSISQSTVHEYVSAARAAGVKWPLPENWDDRQIEHALFPQRPAPAVWRKHPEPDWPPILEELQKHRDLTLALIWQERRESDPEGYGYSRFCDLYRRWLNKRDLVLRHEHRAGDGGETENEQRQKVRQRQEDARGGKGDGAESEAPPAEP